MLITFTDRCLHQVNPWTTPPTSIEETLLPGRIGVVGFSPAESLKYLENRSKGWAVDTAMGCLPVLY